MTSRSVLVIGNEIQEQLIIIRDSEEARSDARVILKILQDERELVLSTFTKAVVQPMVEFNWALSPFEMGRLYQAGPDPVEIQKCATSMVQEHNLSKERQ